MDPTANQPPEDDQPNPLESSPADSDPLGDFRAAFERTRQQDDPAAPEGMLERLRRLGRLGLRPKPLLKEHQSDVFPPETPPVRDAADSIEWIAQGGPPYAPFGQFKLLDLIGDGTSAFVFRALDTKSKEIVALKIGRSHLLQNQTARARFDREMKLTASLQHPQLVRVIGTGEIKEHPYLALEFCDGTSLAQWSAQNPQSLTPEQGARLVMLLAEAVAYAQLRGIVHRDIKPENILLDVTHPIDGLPFNPKLADFGVATVLHERSLSASTGSLVGTPQYIAPEQIDRRSSDLTPATDVYGLGTVLYFLLVGEPPVGRTDARTALMRTLLGNIPPVRLRVPTVPERLAQICEECLRRQPHLRCQSASALAEDLRAFIEQRRGKWRVYRTLATIMHAAVQPRVNLLMTGMLAAVIAFLAVLCFWLVGTVKVTQEEVLKAHLQAEADRDESLRTVQQSQTQLDEVERTNHELLARDYEHNLRLIQLHMERREFDTARRRFDAQAKVLRERERSSKPVQTGLEWRLLSQRLQTQSQTMLVEGNVPQHCIAVSPQGDQIVVAGADGMLRVFSGTPDKTRTAPRVLSPLKAAHSKQVEVNFLQFTRDGQRLASVGDDGSLVIWETRDWTQLSRHIVVEENCHHVAFVGNEQFVACGGKRGSIRIVEPETGEVKGTIKHVGDLLALSSFNNGAKLVAAGSGAIQIWDAATLTLDRSFSGHNDRVLAVAISNDERLLVSGGRDQVLCVWSLETGELLAKRELPQKPTAVAISPSREVCVVGTLDGSLFSVCLSKAGKGECDFAPELPFQIPAHQKEVYSVRFASDGKSVLSASRDGTACKIESLLYDDPVIPVAERKGPIHRVVKFPATSKNDPEMIATVRDKHIDLWDADQWKLLRSWDAETTRIHGRLIDASPVSSGMAALSDAGELVIWSKDGELQLVRKLAVAPVDSHAFHAEHGLAVFQKDVGRLSVFDWQLNRTTTTWSFADCQTIVWSPDGKSMAMSTGAAVQVWSWPDVTLKKTIPFSATPVWAMAFAEDELALCSDRLQIHSLSSAQAPVTSEIAVDRPCSIQYMEDVQHDRLLTCDDSAQIRVWDRESGNQLTAHTAREPIKQVIQLRDRLVYLTLQDSHLRCISIQTPTGVTTKP